MTLCSLVVNIVITLTFLPSERGSGATIFVEHVQRTVDRRSRICKTESWFSRRMGKTGFNQIVFDVKIKKFHLSCYKNGVFNTHLMNIEYNRVTNQINC
jgi:hypothetical protein